MATNNINWEQINNIEIRTILDDLKIPYKETTRKGEIMLVDHTSCKINGNKWYRFSKRTGGYPARFLTHFFDYSKEEAIIYLAELCGLNISGNISYQNEYNLLIPKRAEDNNKIVKYLLLERCIDEEVLRYFIDKDLIYEDDKYHNVVFIGLDEKNCIKHIAKRSVNLTGEQIKLNAYGSDDRYSFHYLGNDNQLYIFESPIDMLSYITLNKESWQKHSYMAMCGLNEIPIKQMLKKTKIDTLFICLDNDAAGENFAYYLYNSNEFQDYNRKIIKPSRKDFNEDLKEINNKPFVSVGDVYNKNLNKTVNKLNELIVKSKSKNYNDLMNDVTFLCSKRNSYSNKMGLVIDYCEKIIIDTILLANQQYNQIEENKDCNEILRELILIPLDKNSESIDEWFKYIHHLYSAFVEFLVTRKQFDNRGDKKNLIRILLNLGKACLNMEVYLMDKIYE